MRREELELAHTCRVTVPWQYGVLRVVGTTELLSTSKLALLSLPCELVQQQHPRHLCSHGLEGEGGKQLGLAALRCAGGDTHWVVPLPGRKVGIAVCEPVPIFTRLHQGLSLPLGHGTFTAYCGTAGACLLSAELSCFGQWWAGRQLHRQSRAPHRQPERARKYLRETREAKVWVMADLL